MISRRLIRIKSFKALFAFEGSGKTGIAEAEKSFLLSCEKVRELYYFLLNFSSSLISYAEERIEVGLHKFHPTEEEAHPNRKFVENKFAKLVADDPELGRFCQKHGLVWSEYDVLVKKIYSSIVTKDYFKNYMASDDDSFEADCNLFSCIFQDEFEDNEDLEAVLEDISIMWIDDLAYVLNVIIDGIEITKRKHKITHVNTFLKEEDREFAIRLLDESAIRYDEYFDLICKKLDNWKADRVVSTDAALIVMGITEAVCFPTIPVKATINEYVEIAKYYSTPNSRIFVNGILDKVIQEKISEGEIVKQGRGLLEN